MSQQNFGVARLTVVLAAAAITSCFPSTSYTQDVDQSRGVDISVDYAALAMIGPWDDRNYQLTASDLEVLAKNEADLKEPIPVFFRVMMRRANPELPTRGEAQYPRNALNIFFQRCGGYLVNGRYYRTATFSEGRFEIPTEGEGVKSIAADALTECDLIRGDGR